MTPKKEYIWPREFGSYLDAKVALVDAFADYNNQRIHSAIEYMMPTEFAMQWMMRNKRDPPYGKSW